MVRYGLLLCVLLLALTVQAHSTPSPVHLVPAYGPAYSSTDDLLRQLLEEVKGLRKDVQSMRGGGAGGSHDLGSVIAARCLGCHGAKDAEAKGGSFVLVENNGVMAELSAAEKRRIVRLVETGKMPPTGKLSADEIKAFSPLKESVK